MRMGADRLRPSWASLPVELRTPILTSIGGDFVSDSPAHGGFSAGYAAVVRTTAGDAFVKAIASDSHADSRTVLRREIAVLRATMSSLAPSLVDPIDDDSGTAIVLESIDGSQPGAPWHTQELHAIAEGIAQLAETTAPPSVVAAEDAMMPGFTRWQRIADEDSLWGSLPTSLRGRLPDLIALDGEFADAVRGVTLAHGDLRADNVLISHGRVRFLDWPHARRGAAWLDLPLLLPSIEAVGGPRCEDAWKIFRSYGAPSPAELLPVISGFASFLWFGQAQAAIAELPGLRSFQRAQAIPALRWSTALL
ncbi:phosphotransferase [Microbacterium murale]|uniref:Aminoglycoside phosphotransferase (APT) family kinase protein n=1 Tax=Microbacterium murale TaxID=1081040 RepID=A0ABU0PDY2_9MICO|nr:phosphotransferase [Microbacterium murale]MDQ0645523.1 aminoglycoside phosphotransferase (APT) family kinase protein [Microbacterium murale]